VVDGKGLVLADHQPKGVRVLKETTAYLVTDMLKSVLEYGTAKHLAIRRPAAGKTGTTDEKVSLWFAGYTPSLVVTVYIGDDKQASLPGYGGTLPDRSGLSLSTRPWLMSHPGISRYPPKSLPGYQFTFSQVLLAGPGCEWSIDSAFIQGTEPTEYAPCTESSESSPESPNRRETCFLGIWTYYPGSGPIA